MTDQGFKGLELKGDLLCEVEIELSEKAPLTVGPSPWRNRRVSDIVGGTINGPRLSGHVLPSGADWSELGQSADGAASITLDVRSVWELDDGTQIYVTYGGRLVIPGPVLATFGDPAQVESIDPGDYYFRTLPTFETRSDEYDWLNHIVTVGLGQRTAKGVRYRVFEIL